MGVGQVGGGCKQASVFCFLFLFLVSLFLSFCVAEGEGEGDNGELCYFTDSRYWVGAEVSMYVKQSKRS